MEPKKPIGELFDSIMYNSVEDVENLIENLTKEQSMYMVSLSIDKAIRNNLFTLQELEIISKSLRIINKNLIE